MEKEITGPKKELESLTKTFLSSVSEDRQAEIDSDNRAIEDKKRKEKYFEFVASSGIPLRHREFVVDSNKNEQWGIALKKVVSILERGGIATILGKRGCGKTQLGVAAILEFLGKRGGCRYVKAIEISMAIRETYKDDGDSERRAVGRFCEPKVLVIDAIEERSGNEWEDRIFNHILDKRYDAVKGTVLISNETEDQFKKSIGLSIISRIIETGDKIVCDWDSFRVKKAEG